MDTTLEIYFGCFQKEDFLCTVIIAPLVFTVFMIVS